MNSKILILILGIIIVISGCVTDFSTKQNQQGDQQTFGYEANEPITQEIDLSGFHLKDFVIINFLKGTGTAEGDDCLKEFNFEKNSYKITVKRSGKCGPGNMDGFNEIFTTDTNDKSIFKIDDFPVLDCDSFSYGLKGQPVHGYFNIERINDQTTLNIGVTKYTGSGGSNEELYNEMIENIKNNFVDCETSISE